MGYQSQRFVRRKPKTREEIAFERAARSVISLPKVCISAMLSVLFAYRPKLATREEVESLVDELPSSRLEPYYELMIRRANPFELQQHITQLRAKLRHNQKVLNCNGRGRYAPEYKKRKGILQNVNLELIDTISALETALAQADPERAANGNRKEQNTQTAKAA